VSKLLCEGYTNCCALGFLQFICLGFPKELFVGVVSLSNYALVQGHLTTHKGVLLFFGTPVRAKKLAQYQSLVKKQVFILIKNTLCCL
jgi:hypothetical protein